MSTRVAPSRVLCDLGIDLPPVTAPLAAYTPAVPVDQRAPAAGRTFTVRTSGQLPVGPNGLMATGRLGADVTPETAYACARQSALCALAAAADVAGGLDAVRAVSRVTAFVASTPDFTGQAHVANGASELFGQIFAEPGTDENGAVYPTQHTRSAVGVTVLPLNAPVEIEVEFLVRI